MNKLLTNFFRLGFLAWLVFETLNWIGVLHFALDFTWKGLVMTAGFIWLSIEIVSWRLRKATGQALPWFVFMIALFSVSIDAFGDINHWYSRFSWYDQMAHVVGGGTAALVSFFLFWQLVRSGRIVLGKKLTGFFAFSVGSFLGVVYELEEYLEDVFTGSHRLGDGPDTANDLLWNAIGALVFVGIAVLLIRHAGHSEARSAAERPKNLYDVSK